MAGAFAGLRFLDLSRLLPGPYCSLLFADLGAEVIKVEEPGRGDYARSTPPYWGDSRIGAYFLLLNRNKKSLAIDLKADRAAGRLLIQQWTWMHGPQAGDQTRIDEALARFEAFQFGP